MELKKQVPQKDLCKRMLELGWDKETVLEWVEYPFPKQNPTKLRFVQDIDTCDFKQCYPAPTVAELGEALPEYIKIDSINYRFQTWRTENNGEWGIRYTSYNCNYDAIEQRHLEIPIEKQFIPNWNETQEDCFFGKTEADARAKMWIFLKENKLI